MDREFSLNEVHHFDLRAAYPRLDVYFDYRSPYLPNTVLGKYERPWNEQPPAGSWRLFMVSCPIRDGVDENTTEALVDLLRGMVDTGLLRPDDVIRDIVMLTAVRRYHVRGWRRAQTEEER